MGSDFKAPLLHHSTPPINIMKVLEAIVARRSVRKFKRKPVDEEQLRLLLESARLAPSGSNRQPWQFIVVRSEKAKKEIAAASHHQSWMLDAPLFLVCVADPVPRLKGKEPFSVDDNSPEPVVKKIIRDTSIAIEHIVLQAEALGLATCWVAYFSQGDMRPMLEVPSDKYIVAVLPIGYADEQPEAMPRKSLEEMVYYESWGKRA